MNRLFTIATGLLLAGNTLAQWTVPVPVQLDGTTDERRQVTGVAPPQAGSDGATLHTDRYQQAAFALATGTDTLLTGLTPPLEAYRAGLRLTLVPQHANRGAVVVNVDALGYIPLLKEATHPMDSADLRSGVPLEMLYDGSVFQVVNQLYPGCPPGFKPMGRDGCVEVAISDTASWYGAANRCTARGYRLCSFAEWMHACSMPGGILPTVLDFEWVDEAANHVNYAKLMGKNDAGELGCALGGLRIPQGTAPYRCCSTR